MIQDFVLPYILRYYGFSVKRLPESLLNQSAPSLILFGGQRQVQN